MAISPQNVSDQPKAQTGYITVLAVHPDYENGFLGEHLLQKAEQYFLTQNLKQISVPIFWPHYFFPGIDVRYSYLTNLFLKSGYTIGDKQPVDMEIIWDHYEPPSWLEEVESGLADQGYFVDYAKPKYHAAFLDFMQTHFPGTWYSRAKTHLESGQNLEKAILILNTEGKVVGFVRFDMNDGRGYIDSIGVQSDLRGKRLGSVLLAYTLQGMAESGVTCATFPATSAVRFYETVGAQIVRRYQLFDKTFAS